MGRIFYSIIFIFFIFFQSIQAEDIIKRNQVIGKVGTSGILNAPGLYFEIRYKGKPLDPAQWLRRKKG